MENDSKIFDGINLLGGKYVLILCNDDTFPTFGVHPPFYLELNFLPLNSFPPYL